MKMPFSKVFICLSALAIIVLAARARSPDDMNVMAVAGLLVLCLCIVACLMESSE